MKSEPRYLKQNVLVEPRFSSWYAWAYLLPPANAAMYVANMHLQVMRSFVAAPQTHRLALQDPAMRGGPFMNLDPAETPRIQSLIRRTETEQALLLKLADAIKSLEKLLANEATGFSMAPLYAKTPDLLKGYVELVYDLNNNPSFRLIEPLLYRSPFYDASLQSVALSLIEHDERPFVFSTPRLDSDERFTLRTAFQSQALDELFKMKRRPQPLGYLRERLEINAETEGALESFFTDEPPQPQQRYVGPGVRIRYLGHACVLIETKDAAVIFDPVISYRVDGAAPRFTYADLPEHIDLAVITHNHQDHCMLETLLQLRHQTDVVVVPRSAGGTLADPSLKLALQHAGFRNVTEIAELETAPFDDGTIAALPFPGEHGDLDIRTKMAYLVCVKGVRILLLADSNNLEPMLYAHLQRICGEVDVLFIGMECDGAPMSWLYGPLMSKPLPRKMDQTRRFDGSDFEKAIQIVDRFQPKQVYVYAMGQEPWLTFLTSIVYTSESRPIVESDKLIAECRRRGFVSERLFGSKEILLPPR
jgi:L-ascorbate metabolism protein UlaG (beta-lactamase superfamily)